MCDMTHRDNRKVDLVIQENSFSLNQSLHMVLSSGKGDEFGQKSTKFSYLANGHEMGKGGIVGVCLNIDLFRYPVECFILKYFPVGINQNNFLKTQFLSTE